MANTVTQRTLVGGGNSRNVVRLIHIVSDGTEESDLIIYNNSDFINDPSKGSLQEVHVMGSTALLRLEWDQTADSPILSISSGGNDHMNFRSFGGISNPNGTGATGDLLLTTANMDSGDEVTLIVHIHQS